jgi:Protein of unknown function (DUF3168)
MSAVMALQAALVAALAAHPDIAGKVSGIFDGPPPRAAFPFISISESITSDWSAVEASGREIRLAITIWDDGEAPARLHALVAAVEDVVAGMPRALTGWRLITTMLLRSLIIRDPSGPWAGVIDHRFRLQQA